MGWKHGGVAGNIAEGWWRGEKLKKRGGSPQKIDVLKTKKGNRGGKQKTTRREKDEEIAERDRVCERGGVQKTGGKKTTPGEGSCCYNGPILKTKMKEKRYANEQGHGDRTKNNTKKRP